MLVIHKSCLQPADNGTVRLVTPVTETAGGSSTRHEIWVEVDEAYKEFLCLERCDAMLLGLLHYAMEKGHDIQAELPVSRELYFNLTNLLIPLLCGEKETVYKKVALQMTVTAERLPNAGAVGTGISLGIDSFYTISRHTKEAGSPYPVTHLLFFNVGSHGRDEKAELTHQEHLKKVSAFADEYGYKLITLNSNYASEFRQHYCNIHAYAAAFAAFSLQKLWSDYHYASAGFSKMTLSLPIRKKVDGGHLMPVINGIFMTENLHFRADAEGVSRVEKTRYLSNVEMAQKYLYVCTRSTENCCRCNKCTRTLLTLRILGAKQKFSAVFPAEKCSFFRELMLLLKRMWKRDPFSFDIIAAYFKRRK